MNRLHDPDVFDDHATSDREISLGMPTILGIFFALALICAVFFGAGYTMGRKSAQDATSVPPPAPTTTTFGGPKPTAGSPAASAPAVIPASLPSSAVVVPSGPAAAPPQPAAKSTASPADAAIVG